MPETSRRLPASHAASALGFTDWSSPLGTYLSCMNHRDFDENNDKPEKGVSLMPALRKWVSKETGLEFFSPRVAGVGMGGKRLDYLSALPDGLSPDLKKALLVFTPRRPEDWLEDVGEEDGDEVVVPVKRKVMPREVRIEAAVVQAVLNVEVHVAALLAGRLRLMTYEPDARFEKTLLSALHMFWQGNVLAGRPPAATAADEQLLRELFPKPTQAASVRWAALTQEQRETVVKWAGAQRQRTAAVKIEKETRPLVVQAIGGAAGICEIPPDTGIGLSSVSFETRDPYPNNGTWKAIATEALEKWSPRAAKAALARHTPTVGTRVLRPFFNAIARTSPPPEHIVKNNTIRDSEGFVSEGFAVIDGGGAA